MNNTKTRMTFAFPGLFYKWYYSFFLLFILCASRFYTYLRRKTIIGTTRASIFVIEIAYNLVENNDKGVILIRFSQYFEAYLNTIRTL